MTAELQRICIYIKYDKKMDPARKNWNIRQKKLRTFLTNPVNYHQAIDLFLQQHAEVHSARMSSVGSWSFEDEVFNDMADSQIRCIPDQMEHSIVWIIWHLARIEDVTMNLLVAGKKTSVRYRQLVK